MVSRSGLDITGACKVNTSLHHILTSSLQITFPRLKQLRPRRHTHLAVDNHVDGAFLDDVPRCAFLSLVEH